MLRLTLVWVGLVPVMIANGIARQSLYGSTMSELGAHQLSTLTGAVLLLGYTWLLFPWMEVDSPRAAWVAGAVWLALTVAFEFGFGHYVAGHSWSRLLQDYDLLAGRVWVLFLALVLAAPRLILSLRGARLGA